MPDFSLRALILLVIGALLIFRLVSKFGAAKSNRAAAAGRGVSGANAFCVHCGAPFQAVGEFCGGCGARRG